MKKRILDCNGSDFLSMSAEELKYAILASEGRTILAQSSVKQHPLQDDVSNPEIEAAFGADLIMLNNYNFKDESLNVGMDGLSLPELKKLVKRPVGVYFECPSTDGVTAYNRPDVIDYSTRIASEENIEKALAAGASFIVLGGNPGRGTKMDVIIESTRKTKEIVGDRAMIWAGKWEDGVIEKVMGDSLAEYDAKEVTKQLIDAGADVINLPAPGSRHGITVESIKELVDYAHRYKPRTLVMSFLNSSVEGADEDTVKMIALLMKQTGADIHAIGDAGYMGVAIPENLYQLSISIRGRRFTQKRMAANNR